MIAPDLYNDLMDRLAEGSREDLLLAERLRADSGASTLRREAARRRVFYVTFGVQYATAAEWATNGHRGDPHPYVDWATGNGYLAVEYGLSETDIAEDTIADRRERARQAVHAWLNGVYAFDQDDVPEPRCAPLGEVARLVLP